MDGRTGGPTPTPNRHNAEPPQNFSAACCSRCRSTSSRWRCTTPPPSSSSCWPPACEGAGVRAGRAEAEAEAEHDTQPKVVYIPLDPITVSLPQRSEQKHLLFRAQLEVEKKHAEDVEQVIPRIVDVLNTYLRAVEVRDIQDPSALARLRSQMLRRIHVVAGHDRVNDLLIMEFVLN